MRGKKAKRLREAARKLTVGQPWAVYEPYYKKQPGGTVSFHVRMRETCTRWLYKQLKKVATGKTHRVEAKINTR